MNKTINFELAKLLKSKGYDNETGVFYTENGEVLVDLDWPSLQSSKPDIYYDAPTIADVVMWLYDTHGIWIVARPISRHEFKFTIYAVNVSKRSDLTDATHKTPNEAYEAAIEYVLNNLI